MKNIEKKVVEFIENNKLISAGDKVYVAASGGADSMALLAFMYKFKDYYDIEIGAVHVNHGMRDETADRDMNHVKEYCEKHGIEYVVFNAKLDGTDIPSNASEEWARNLRYNYFKNLGECKIATAHTMSDQAETLLFRLARGCGMKGLEGINIKRDNYIRPVMCLNRAEIEELCEYYGVTFMTDESNLTDDYSRNKIRHHVVPVLKDVNGGFENNIASTCEKVSKAYKYIQKQAAIELEAAVDYENARYFVEGFIDADEVILEEMIIQLISKNAEVTENMVELIKNKIYNAQAYMYMGEEFVVFDSFITDGVRVIITNKYIRIKNEKKNKSICFNHGYTEFGQLGYHIVVDKIDYETFKNSVKSKEELCMYADADKIKTSDYFRNKQDGDKFKPACKVGGKVSKFMRGIGQYDRDDVPMLIQDGQVIWLWGVGFTDGFTPDENTKQVYKINWTRGYF